MFNTHDVPVLLIQILLDKPWFRNGKIYSGGRWMTQKDEALCQAEAQVHELNHKWTRAHKNDYFQVWLALHQLLTHPSCATHYSLTDSRRSQLMKLLPLMSPILLDQLSPLIDLKHWLCRISVSDTSSAPTKPVLLEPVMEIKQSILKEGEGKWKKIASKQVSVIFNSDPKELMEVAKRYKQGFYTLCSKWRQTIILNQGRCGIHVLNNSTLLGSNIKNTVFQNSTDTTQFRFFYYGTDIILYIFWFSIKFKGCFIREISSSTTHHQSKRNYPCSAADHDFAINVAHKLV